MLVQTVESFQMEYMSLEEAAQVLRVQVKTFYDRRWREKMGIVLYSFGNARRKYVRREHIFSLLKAS